jgi:hypothetical protein
MTSIPRQLATFAAVLAGLYTAGFIAGQFIDAEPHGGDDMTHEQETTSMTTKTHQGAEHGAAEAPDPVRGLAIADNGLQLELADPELEQGRAEPLRFRIVDARGAAVRDFDIEHEKRMHLIVARRDLTGFQHLHPTMDENGTWSTPLRLDEAGSYRVFADFVRDGEATTLAGDLRVDGAADLRPLPAPAPTAITGDGYEVRLDPGDARPGQESELRFTVTKDGAPVKTEPYLGAGGHLVALRDGDLAFLHVHPTDHDSVEFAAAFPTAGRYRLFLQFQHDGRVQTAAFTQAVR